MTRPAMVMVATRFGSLTTGCPNCRDVMSPRGYPIHFGMKHTQEKEAITMGWTTKHRVTVRDLRRSIVGDSIAREKALDKLLEITRAQARDDTMATLQRAQERAAERP